MIVIGFIVQISLLSFEMSDDEHRTMYIGNFMVVDQVTQSDDDLNAFGRRYGEPHRPPDNSGYHRLKSLCVSGNADPGACLDLA